MALYILSEDFCIRRYGACSSSDIGMTTHQFKTRPKSDSREYFSCASSGVVRRAKVSRAPFEYARQTSSVTCSAGLTLRGRVNTAGPG